MININPLFEALQYFHRRAEGRLVRIELDRLCTRFPSKTNEFLRLLSPVADLQDRLDYLVRVGKRELGQLLTPVCSSPTPFACSNSISACSASKTIKPTPFACSNSIMYMMVFPAIRDGIDPENFTEYIYSKTDEDIMVDILSVLESPGTATVTEEITSDVFYERLENTGLDEQSRLGVMKLLFKYKSYSERVSLLVDGFLNAMRRERENVASICSAFSKRYPEGSGVLKKVNDCYGMGLPDDIEMTPYCSIFMYDHIAAFVKQYQDDTGKDSGMVLMGIGYDLVSSVRDIISSPEELAMLFKALSEPSRLDIINLLRESPAYGQELSEKTALHPTTISHHMARLVAANLVECDLRTAKTYYTLNKEYVIDILDRLRAVFSECDDSKDEK